MKSRVIEGSGKIKVFNLLRQVYEKVDYSILSKVVSKGISIEIVDDNDKLLACAILNPIVDNGYISVVLEAIHGTELEYISKCLKIVVEGTANLAYSPFCAKYLNTIGMDRLCKIYDKHYDRIPIILGADLTGLVAEYTGGLEARMLTSKYVEKTAELLVDYHREINPTTIVGNRLTARRMLSMPENTMSESIIILVDKGTDEVVGFTSLMINSQYEMLKNSLYVEYSYLVPKYRRGKAIAILYALWGKICKKADCALTGTIYVGCGNHNNAKIIDAEIVANEFRLESEEASGLYNKYGNKYEVGFNETTG